MKGLPSSVLLCLFVTVNKARNYEKCQLARILNKANMDGFQGISLADWVCLATHASNLDSEKVYTDSQGVRQYGLFQLSSAEHCHDNSRDSENLCNTCCVYYLNEDLSDDIECLKKHVIQHGGLAYWSPWRNNCAGRRIQGYIKNCNLASE